MIAMNSLELAISYCQHWSTWSQAQDMLKDAEGTTELQGTELKAFSGLASWSAGLSATICRGSGIRPGH